MEEVKVKKPRKNKSSGVNEASEVIEQAAAEAQEQKLSPKEQAEMLRNYVSSMEKTAGYSDENVRDIIEAVYRRFLLILNYNAMSKLPEMKEVKASLKNIYEDEISRYSGEGK